MMRTADGIVKEMKRDGEMKSAFWKYSLGIETAGVAECFKKYMPEVEKVVGENGDVKKIMRVVAKRAKVRTTRRARGRAIKDAKVRSEAFASTIGVVELLMKVFPHSTYGHYPYRVECDGGRKRSTDLYVEYKENLKNLIDDVEKACGKSGKHCGKIGQGAQEIGAAHMPACMLACLSTETASALPSLRISSRPGTCGGALPSARTLL